MKSLIHGIILFILAMIIYFDWKDQEVPAFITTSLLIMSIILNISSGLNTAILSVLFGLLLIEQHYFSGLADLKVFIALGAFTQLWYSFFWFMAIILFSGLLWKVIAIKFLNKKHEIAFTPVFLLTYIVMIITNMV